MTLKRKYNGEIVFILSTQQIDWIDIAAVKISILGTFSMRKLRSRSFVVQALYCVPMVAHVCHTNTRSNDHTFFFLVKTFFVEKMIPYF